MAFEIATILRPIKHPWYEQQHLLRKRTVVRTSKRVKTINVCTKAFADKYKVKYEGKTSRASASSIAAALMRDEKLLEKLGLLELYTAGGKNKRKVQKVLMEYAMGYILKWCKEHEDAVKSAAGTFGLTPDEAAKLIKGINIKQEVPSDVEDAIKKVLTE